MRLELTQYSPIDVVEADSYITLKRKDVEMFSSFTVNIGIPTQQM